MKITVLYSESPSDYHRLLQPVKYISDPSITFNLVHQKDCKEKEAETFHCDILWLSRIFIYEWQTLEDLKKKYGFKIVVDFDDYHKLTSKQLRYKIWQDHNVQNRMIDAAKGTDLVMVTNEQLYKVYKEFNSNVAVVPNGLSFEGCRPPKYVDYYRTRFLYAGGISHYNDIMMLKGLFRRLRGDSQFKTKGSFVFCGYDKSKLADKIRSLAFIPDAYNTRNLEPLSTYMNHYCNGDVSVAPLEDNLYNNCKSNLKFIESASAKLPFICSDVLPYTADKQCEGIIYCNTTNDWYKAFKFFLNNPKEIAVFGEKNYEYAKKNYNITDINTTRVASFKNLLI